MASVESAVELIGLLELLVFVLVLFGFMARLCRVPVKLTVQSKASQNIGALLFLLLCVAIVVSTFGSAHTFGWTKFTPSLAMKIAGDLIMLPSIIVMGWSQYHLGKQWTAAIQIVQDHKLITSGPYAYVRHPFLLSILGLNIGAVLFAGGWLSFVTYLVNFCFSMWLIPLEEQALATEFGSKFEDYKQTTGAIVPCFNTKAVDEGDVFEENNGGAESAPIRRVSATLEKYGTIAF
eukprot:TRINITY_DN3962_c0_g1_i1.p1 TRINITY_DN3962_c0_g1~~TRINITY_DN3962_c0_g1_i1.p1  ORF type:complete len:265 (+),score=59.32 TRINITY_DN3962_c0_g1_i1:93-797(+)